MRRSDILSVLRTALAQREEVLDAYVFGSEARGTSASHSDIDIAVYVDPLALERPGFGYDAELSAALMSALRTNGVDVVVLNGAPPLLYHRVLRDGERLLSRDLRATTTREGRALSRYCDYRAQLESIQRSHSARTARGEFGR
jgi:predicted nucleotidyltransferase